MNIAFQALAIFALVLPGIILKNAYRGGFFWDRPRQTLSIPEEIAYSLLLAGTLHAVYGAFVDRWIWPVDLESTALILLGQFGKDSAQLSSSVTALTSHPIRLLLYFGGLYLSSGLLGFAGHALIRHFKLDIKHPALRFDHQWHYLLRGEICRFPESSIEFEGDIDAIIASCVVVTSGQTFLYVGVLDSFYFNKSGDLDVLVLTGAMRRSIEAEQDTEGERPSYYFIEAEYLYLKYSEVKNVSMRYVRTIEEDTPES